MVGVSRGMCAVAAVVFIFDAAGIKAVGPVEVLPIGLAFFAGAFVWWPWR